MTDVYRSHIVSLNKKTLNAYSKVNKSNGENLYFIITDYGESGAGKDYEKEGIFRYFIPVNPLLRTRLCAAYDTDDSKFDMNNDTIMDYPSIINYKLNHNSDNGLDKYNRLLCFQIARCVLDCWHCYLDECIRYDCINCGLSGYCDNTRKKEYEIKENYYSVKQILSDFFNVREIEKEKKKPITNVLRITGGEPLLAPNLILEILKELRRMGKEKEIFVWTETNIVPLITIKDNGDSLISDELLKELSLYQNFAIHPCFHGLNKDNFEEITGNKIDDYNKLFAGFKRLLEARIDVYPTFGTNVSSDTDISNFYNEISKLNKYLPLRFCLIEETLSYKPIVYRYQYVPNFARHHEKVYDHSRTVQKWNGLLKENLRTEYGKEPRHCIDIYRG